MKKKDLEQIAENIDLSALWEEPIEGGGFFSKMLPFMNLIINIIILALLFLRK